MKRYVHYVFLSGLLVFFSGCSGNAQSQQPAVAATGADRIEVLDFHTTHRCKTCLTIEQMTREVLAESYAAEVKKGLISFRLINADDKANEVIVKKYLAFGTTLVINTVSNGREEHVDLTNFAFMNAGDAAKFKAGLRENLDAGLKKVKL